MRLNIADATANPSLRVSGGAFTAVLLRLRDQATTLTGILFLAFATRIVWIAFSQWTPTPDDDAYRYDFTARALADGLGYIHLNGEPTAFWPPGYPLLLAGVYAAFGHTIVAGQILNALMGTATVALVYLIGRRLFGKPQGLIAAAIVAFWPSLVFFTAVTLSEVAFTFFALLGVLLLVIEAQRNEGSRRSLGWLLAAGLILGFASLIRGQALLLPLVVVPFWLASGFDRRGVARGLVALALGMGAVVAPWSVRNAVELHEPVLIATNAGVDFWIGHHESATGDFGATGGDELVYRYPEMTSPHREARVNNDGFREGLTYAVTHPAEEVVLPLKKLFWLYYNDEEGLAWNEGHGGQEFLSTAARDALNMLSNVYYFAVLGVLVLGAPFWFSMRHPGRVLLASLVVYWTFIHLAFFGDPRFHAPIMPVVALLAALPLAAMRSGTADPETNVAVEAEPEV